MVIVGQFQVAIYIKTGIGNRLNVRAITVQGDTVCIQIDQHIHSLTVSGNQQVGVDEGSRLGAIIDIAFISQVVGNIVGPSLTAVGRASHQGIQATAVVGGIPADIRSSNNRAVCQSNYGRNSVTLAFCCGTVGERNDCFRCERI